jgi:hypothetical protein
MEAAPGAGEVEGDEVGTRTGSEADRQGVGRLRAYACRVSRRWRWRTRHFRRGFARIEEELKLVEEAMRSLLGVDLSFERCAGRSDVRDRLAFD